MNSWTRHSLLVIIVLIYFLRIHAARNDDVDNDDENTIQGQQSNNKGRARFSGQRQRQRGDRVQQRGGDPANMHAPPLNNNRNNISLAWLAPEANKCRYWVPVEAVQKYPGANIIPPVSKDGKQQIEICCENYGVVRWRGVTYCRPLCTNCRNGFCLEKNECQCFEGFTPNDNGDCVFACPLGCLNGQCYLDGSCQCNPGYKLDETRRYCRPICSGGCDSNRGQNCTEPEVCGCAKGYQLQASGCEKVCDPDCGIGGSCDDENNCQCNEGYELHNGICQSLCYQDCTNGLCVSRNRCICNSGYKYHERTTMCIPQ